MKQKNSLEDKICIIGAGPSGLLAAKRLKELGYTSITIFEKNKYLGGRACTNENGTDIGAVIFGNTIPQNSICTLSKSLGVIPSYLSSKIEYFSLDERKSIKLFSLKKILKGIIEIPKYLLLRRKLFFNTFLKSRNKEINEKWKTFIKKNNISNFGFASKASTEGFGYSWNAPAIYHLKYLRPSIVTWGSMRAFGYWPQGIGQVWETLVKKYQLNVILNTQITKIDRDNEINIVTKNAGYKFDKLILACNLRDIITLFTKIDKEEEEIYSAIITEDYRTYEIKIANFKENKNCMGFFIENLYGSIPNRPYGFFKKSANNDIFVFYVKANGEVDDDTIVKNIKSDIEKIGGKFIKL